MFTQGHIDTNKLSYENDGSNASEDDFIFAISDEDNNERGNLSFSITINPINDSPLLERNEKMTLDEGESMTITAGTLFTSDEESSSNDLVYTIVGGLTAGEIRHIDRDEAVNSFTQEELNLNKIVYQHNDKNKIEDKILFYITDSGGIQILDQVFEIAITATINPLVVSPNGGRFTGSIDVGLSSETEDIEIYYTLDGSVPEVTVTSSAGTSVKATVYNGLIKIDETTTLKAIGIKEGFEKSQLLSVTFEKEVEKKSSKSSKSKKSDDDGEKSSKPSTPPTPKETLVDIDEKQLTQTLNTLNENEVLTITLSDTNDNGAIRLSAQSVREMQNKHLSIEISTDKGDYTLPLDLLDIDELIKRKDIEGQDTTNITIAIETPSKQRIESIKQSINELNMTMLATPVTFSVSIEEDGQIYEVKKFTHFVTRRIRIPVAVDSNAVTTAVVIDESNNIRSVPTQIKTINGVSYAYVQSLTNSTYALVEQVCDFEDVDETYWACESIQEMTDTLVIAGEVNHRFEPEKIMNRGDVVKAIVKALGMVPEKAGVFDDVKIYQELTGYVDTAYDYGLVNSNEGRLFKPFDSISRQDMIVMLYRASQLSGIEYTYESEILDVYKDTADVAEYAREPLKWAIEYNLLPYVDSNLLDSSAPITKAELAVTLDAFLQVMKLRN